MSERTTSCITRTDDLPVSEQEARAELERLLSDPNFRATDRNRRFLRYVSEKLLEGNAKRIKAYAIAVDVFGRPADFDPGLDPIVRIEATRLRASLAHYYDGMGGDRSVRIELPKGGYQPLFIRRPAAIADPPRYSFSEKPRLLVSIMAGSPCAQAETESLREALLSTLSPFQTVTLVTADRNGEASAYPFARVCPRTALAPETSLELHLTYRRLGQDALLCWRLVDRLTGEVLGSARETGLLEGGDDWSLRLARLANRIIGRHGLINCREVRRDLVRPTLGNGCLLRAFHGLRTGDSVVQAQARVGLEASSRQRPSDPDLGAALALLLTSVQPPASRDLQRAKALADGAAALAPYSATAAWAQTAASLALDQKEGGERAARRAVCLNPNDRELLLAIGRLLCLAGNREMGTPLLDRAQLLDDRTDLHAALALATAVRTPARGAPGVRQDLPGSTSVTA